MIELISKVTRTPFVTIATMVTKITKVVYCIYAKALKLFRPADRSERKIRGEANGECVKRVIVAL